jgi:hypothetical protein
VQGKVASYAWDMAGGMLGFGIGGIFAGGTGGASLFAGLIFAAAWKAFSEGLGLEERACR